MIRLKKQTSRRLRQILAAGIAAVLTVWSGAEYLVHYWKDINPNQ